MESCCALITFVVLALNVNVTLCNNPGVNILKIWNMFRLRGHKLAVAPLVYPLALEAMRVIV